METRTKGNVIKWRFKCKINLIGRWLFAGWRVARMRSKILYTGLWLRRNIYHIALGLYFRQ